MSEQDKLMSDADVPRVIAAQVADLKKRGHASLDAWLKSDPTRHVYIGRFMFRIPGATASPWANPFRVDSTNNGLQSALQLYEAHIRAFPDLKKRLETLRGCTLACWCRKHGMSSTGPPEICHGDVIVRLFREHFGLPMQAAKSSVLKRLATDAQLVEASQPPHKKSNLDS